MAEPVQLILCTCPDTEVAERIATALVEERLAACVTMLPESTSIYRWQDRIERDREIPLLIKTQSVLFERLSERLTTLHPYDVPEIIAMDIAAGSLPYLDWLSSCTSQGS